MHQYAITNDHRVKVNYILAILASLVCSAIAIMINDIISPTLNIALTPPSTFAVYMLLFNLYDNFFWNIYPFNSLFKIPNYSGVWKGKLIKNRHNNGSEEMSNVTVTIKQNWSKISICLTGQTSDSRSQTAFIDCDGALPELTYEYISKKRNRSETTIGITRLILHSNEKIEGDFFSELSNKGPIVLAKVKIAN